jgi:hypothetical protein
LIGIGPPLKLGQDAQKIISSRVAAAKQIQVRAQDGARRADIIGPGIGRELVIGSITLSVD